MIIEFLSERLTDWAASEPGLSFHFTSPSPYSVTSLPCQNFVDLLQVVDIVTREHADNVLD